MADKLTVIREVASNLWTFSRPFTPAGIFALGGRSTAIKMNDGGVWVLASTPLNPETKAKIEELGPCPNVHRPARYIVGSNAYHHLYLGEFKRAYPTAKLIAPAGAIERADKSLVFDGVWGRDPPETKYGFEDEIESCYFSGVKNKDVVFFHSASKTLIEADLIFNLPCTEQYSKTTSSGRIPLIGTFNPSTWLDSKLASSIARDKRAMERDAKTVADWDFDRIIPCHGDVIESGGKQAWLTAFKAYIKSE
ncbi:hypothetical protein C8R47DRAFT_1296193 [Mycena vitilis]|nr:hypothetical protein C8R47DRAFT_1296193 [Mycena vitilis]